MNRRLQRFQAFLGRYYIPLISFILSVAIIFLGYSNVQPIEYNFKLNQVAQDTILAPVTTEDVDQTELNRQRARDGVNDVYLYQEDIRTQQLTLIEQYFSFIRQLKNESHSTESIQSLIDEHAQIIESGVVEASLLNQFANVSRPPAQTVTFPQLEAVEQLLIYELKLSDQVDGIKYLGDNINTSTLSHILSIDPESLSGFQSVLTEMVATTLSEEIQASTIERFIELDEQSISNASHSLDARRALMDFLNRLIVPTMTYSEAETERRREEAANAVQTSYILQGQVIIQEGHIIGEDTMRQLDIYGFLDQSSRNTVAYAFYATVLIHGIVMIMVFTKGFKWSAIDLPKQNMQATAYALVMLFVFSLLKGFHLMQTSGLTYATLVVPVFLLPFMITPRTTPRIGIMSVLFFNILALFILNGYDNLTVVTLTSLYYLFSSILGMMFILKKETYNYTLNEFFIPLFFWHMALAIPLLMSLNINLFSEQGMNIILLLATNVFLVNLILFFVTPYWDQLLVDKAALTLNQLGNLNHPLLKRLIENSPGTYHHSILVANLSANAVEAIGGDSLLTRVAAYYHDIGKTVHPRFFTENVNSGMVSPHQMITPAESAAIIMGHVTEGAKILEASSLPKSIIDICMQHHGTTLVKYFYYQAKQESPTVNESDFRYPGPKPQTKEAAIVMIADSVEAASRTLKEYNQQSIETLIDSIINDKIGESQFSECDLTVHDLKIVRQSLISGVAGMYHTRVEYPK